MYELMGRAHAWMQQERGQGTVEYVGLILLLGVILAGVVLCTAGCNPFRRSGEAELCKQDEVLAKAQSVPPLRVPPGLESPDTSRALRIPELNTPPPPPRKVSEGCLDEPPRYMTQKPSEPQA